MAASSVLLVGWIAAALLVSVGAVSIIVRTLRNGVPPMPTSDRVRAGMMALVRQAALPPGAMVVDLGSGWGGVSRELARLLPNATVTGYENSRVPYWFSRCVNRLLRIDNVRFVRADFYGVSLREVDLVSCYLSPDAMTRLQAKLSAELKPSAITISATFALPDWRATRAVVADDMYRSRIYLYHAGRCRLDGIGRQVDFVEPEPER